MYGEKKLSSKNIIIILIVIIIILAAALGILFMQPSNAKEATKIKVTSNKTLTEGDDISVQLTDSNKTPLSKQNVKVTVKNGKGKVVLNKTVKTNSKGKAKIDSNLKKGKYKVKVSYKGNKNYTGNNTTQNLTIKEKVKKTTSESSSSNSQGWTETHPGGDTGSSIVVYHDGNGHKYVTRYSADGSAYEDGVAYDEGAMITS